MVVSACASECIRARAGGRAGRRRLRGARDVHAAEEEHGVRQVGVLPPAPKPAVRRPPDSDASELEGQQGGVAKRGLATDDELQAHNLLRALGGEPNRLQVVPPPSSRHQGVRGWEECANEALCGHRSRLDSASRLSPKLQERARAAEFWGTPRQPPPPPPPPPFS